MLLKLKFYFEYCNIFLLDDGRVKCPGCSNALSEIEEIDDDIEATGYIEVNIFYYLKKIVVVFCLTYLFKKSKYL